MLFIRFKHIINAACQRNTYEEKCVGWSEHDSKMKGLCEREKEGAIEIIGTFRDSYHQCNDGE
ncbi:MAG: hypothetical protein WC365_08425 [Candidatus Babeliales bacterium]|jgi:hypothetical protein